MLVNQIYIINNNNIYLTLLDEHTRLEMFKLDLNSTYYVTTKADLKTLTTNTDS